MTAVSLVPPRPNPGPEPFAERGTSWGWIAAPLVAFALIGLWTFTRRRTMSVKPPESEASGSPSDPIVALAESARAALVERFGAGWRAKTTEEIAAEGALVDAFGIDTSERLLALLRGADRLKFANVDSPSPEPQRDDVGAWSVWVADFEAGARSKINGK